MTDLALRVPPLSAHSAPGWTLLWNRFSSDGSVTRCWKHDETGEIILSGITYATYPNLDALEKKETE